MFRRFRQRRAIRKQEKKNVQNQLKIVSSLFSKSKSMSTSTNNTGSNNIFRSANSTISFNSTSIVPVIQSQSTDESMTTCNDDDNDDNECNQNNNVETIVDNSSPTPLTSTVLSATSTSTTNTTTLSNIITTSSSFGILLDDILTDHKFDGSELMNDTSTSSSSTSTTTNGIVVKNVRHLLDEIHDELYYDINEKDEIQQNNDNELFKTQIELAFLKESYTELQDLIHISETTIQQKDIQLCISNKHIQYLNNEIILMKEQYQSMIELLVDTKLKLLEVSSLSKPKSSIQPTTTIEQEKDDEPQKQQQDQITADESSTIDVV